MTPLHDPPIPAPDSMIWKGSPNFRAGRGNQRAIAVVHHVMLGTLAGTDSTFANPANQVSAHFGLGLDGTIHQYVSVLDTAWANGNLRNPNLAAVPWIQPLCLDPDPPVNPNLLTISIEWEGMHTHGQWIKVPWDGALVDTLAHVPAPQFWAPPPAQYASGLYLTRWLAQTWTIALDRAHITRHSDYDSVTRWFCPGEGFPMKQLILDLGGHL